VYDDNLLITFNPWMQSWWEGIRAAYTHVFWVFADVPRAADYYRPMVMTVLVTVRHVAGSAPGWFHLVAISIHLLAVYLTYRLALALTSNSRLAIIAAGLFALHPSRIESVAWISGISDSMCLVFCLASTLAYFRWKNGASELSRVLSAASLFLAMLSKELSIAIPVLIALYDLMTRSGSLWRRAQHTVRMIWPYCCVVTTALGMRWFAMRHVVLARGPSPMFLNALYSAPEALIWYLAKQLWPLPTSIYYPVLLVTKPTLWQFVVPLVAITIACVWLLWRVRKNPCAVFLLAWFLLTLAPVLAYEPALQLHDRYLYVPSVATSIGCAWLITRFVQQRRFGIPLQGASVGALCLVLASLTVMESRYWSDDVRLSERAIVIGHDQTFPYQALTTTLCRLSQYEKAEKVAMLWVRNTNDPVGGWSAVAQARREQQDLVGAREAALQAIAVSKTPLGRVAPASILGEVSVSQGNWSEAEHWYATALAGEPYAPFLHYGYANALRHLGKNSDAERELELYKTLRGYQGL
jgi:tetratricopeptide (TPR) repeat protein